uniref:NADH-ubiquinone oxidoreductase chain 3 n=1 Tax=Metaphycus eriococci TaxID=2498640 RepID=A0A7T3PGS5_9HYME|nr:NADH dehydrogenase subunit 3 [Metaphycus eriococci]QPZ53226.1 NADH dehydrogenase subunit 3 [Metaphycus eriococci]
MYINLFILIFMILLSMMLMNFIFSKKMLKDREKMSPFECGFDPMSKSRLPFSLQFYLISIIFLIFDVEIAIILPFVYINSLFFYFMYVNMVLVLLILLFGLYLEWWEGALKWFK